MRTLRALAVVIAVVAGLYQSPGTASAATLPQFPMALPVAWGATVQAGGPHTHYSGVRSSVDLGAAGGASIPVVAAADGVVTVKGAGSFSRCMVIINHEDGWQTQYYHLRAIPSGLATGQRVSAGQQIGMTAMPGSETCGRGTFRHVHFSLYRYGIEQPIHGLPIGGYRIHDTAGAYCGYWSRLSDGAIVADARRACMAVPQVTNNIVHPDTLDTALTSAPVIAPQDTIDAVSLYTTPGQHTVNGRAWLTECEDYSTTVERCTTYIWATSIKVVSGVYVKANDWVWNNLTYKASPRSQWAGNPLGNHNSPEGWVSADGRRWRTECDTAVSGGNGCRSWIWGTTVKEEKDALGNTRYVNVNGWVFNNIVHFSPQAPDVSLAATSLSEPIDAASDDALRGGPEPELGATPESTPQAPQEGEAATPSPSPSPTLSSTTTPPADVGPTVPEADAAATEQPGASPSAAVSSPPPSQPTAPEEPEASASPEPTPPIEPSSPSSEPASPSPSVDPSVEQPTEGAAAGN